MQEREKIKLSSIEVTAYWWINVIKDKVREFVIQRPNDKKELKFKKQFYNYTEIEWRKLYLALTQPITEEVSCLMGEDTFSQETSINGHNKLNVELSKILNCPIPDIRLASSSYKDSVIYTNIWSARTWYKSCGTRDLSNRCDPCYILTGDKEELDFYNLVISTIAVIGKLDRSVKSIALIREAFCKEYKEDHNYQKTIEEIEDNFNYSFDKACNKGIIKGKYWGDGGDVYYNSFCDIDLIALKPYMVDAEIYAKKILQSIEDKRGVPYIKKDNNK